MDAAITVMLVPVSLIRSGSASSMSILPLSRARQTPSSLPLAPAGLAVKPMVETTSAAMMDALNFIGFSFLKLMI